MNVRSILRRGVSERSEFISSINHLDDIGRTVCAMLNGRGGILHVGISNNGIIESGISSRDARRVCQYLQGKIIPEALIDIGIEDVDGESILIIDVPSGRDCPYVYNGTVYIRKGKNTKNADSKSMRQLVEHRAIEPERWERRMSPGLELNDLSMSLLRQTVKKAQTNRGYTFSNPNDMSSVLHSLSLERNGQFTNGSDVLFGLDVSLHHPQTRMRAVCYSTNKGGEYIDDKIFEGPAFEILESAMAFLKRHVSIAAVFPLGQLNRESRPAYPYNAVREGLVNALVHRDYASSSGGTSISIYPNRVEIWNSGHLPNGISISELRHESHRSILVNPDLSFVFYLQDLMERVGRGTFKIIQDCHSFGMKPPKWEDKASGVVLTYFAAMHQQNKKDIQLNERQTNCVWKIHKGEIIGRDVYIKQFGPGITDRQARRDLICLVELGYLKRLGGGRNTKYERTELI